MRPTRRGLALVPWFVGLSSVRHHLFTNQEDTGTADIYLYFSILNRMNQSSRSWLQLRRQKGLAKRRCAAAPAARRRMQ
jgi:hypothetical protein